MNYFERVEKRMRNSQKIELKGFWKSFYDFDNILQIHDTYVVFNNIEVPLSQEEHLKLYQLAEELFNKQRKKDREKDLEKLEESL